MKIKFQVNSTVRNIAESFDLIFDIEPEMKLVGMYCLCPNCKGKNENLISLLSEKQIILYEERAKKEWEKQKPLMS